MGQYHVPLSVDGEEALSAHVLGCGLKEAEQGFTRPGTPAALVALVCARGGNMPADCSQSPLVGKWAGHRVLIQGDYAEDTDIPGWDGPPLSLLYSARDTQEERDSETAHRQKMIDEGMKGCTLPDWSNVPFYTDISDAACAFLEGACNIRFFGERPYQEWVHVKPHARHFGDCGVAEYVIDESHYDARGLEWLKRQGMQPIDVQRGPRSGDWHGIRHSDIPEGQTRVIVNLDTGEYLNPVVFEQVPTLAGMVNAAPKGRKIPLLVRAEKDCDYLVDVAGALFALLCHPERRGGGDLPSGGEEMKNIDPERAEFARLFEGAEQFKGRWRGGHILGTSEHKHEDRPSTEEVLEQGTDISAMAIQYLVAASHY